MTGELRTVYGLKPVLEALDSSPVAVRSLFLAQGLDGPLPRKLRDLAMQLGIPIRSVPRAELQQRCGSDHHQGAVATLAGAPSLDFEALLQPGPKDLLLVADSVQDPQNLGALMRSTEFWAGRAVLVPRHGASGLTGAVGKASAGAAERLPLVTVTNVARSLDALKQAGYWCYGAVAEDGQPLHQVQFHSPTVLVLGSEGSGIRPLVARSCDVLVTIPRLGKMESLNVANAAAVMLWELRRQQAVESRAVGSRSEAPSSGGALDNARLDH